MSIYIIVWNMKMNIKKRIIDYPDFLTAEQNNTDQQTEKKWKKNHINKCMERQTENGRYNINETITENWSGRNWIKFFVEHFHVIDTSSRSARQHFLKISLKNDDLLF